MKEKAVVTFKRLADGTLTAEVTGPQGNMIASRNFGKVSEQELKRIMSEIEKLFPDLAGMSVDLTGN